MKEKLQPVSNIHLQMQDAAGKLTEGIIDNWLLGIRESNPAILDMLKFPDKKPSRKLLPGRENLQENMLPALRSSTA